MGDTPRAKQGYRNLKNVALIKITGVGSTTMNSPVIDSQEVAQWASTIVTEGAIYEAASGRAGAAAKNDMAHAQFMDFIMNLFAF